LSALLSVTSSPTLPTHSLSLHDALPIFLVVNKPAGVEVDGSADDTLLKRVCATLAERGGASQAVLCHRLDAGTSGLILLARNAADRKSTRLNSSHVSISYAVFCLKKKKK